MRDEHRGAARGGAQEVGGKGVGGGHVEMFGRFVENEYGEVGEERPGQGEALPLSPGEPRTMFSDECVQTLRQRVHPGEQPGGGERGPQVVVGGIRTRQAQVLPQ